MQLIPEFVFKVYHLEKAREIAREWGALALYAPGLESTPHAWGPEAPKIALKSPKHWQWWTWWPYSTSYHSLLASSTNGLQQHLIGLQHWPIQSKYHWQLFVSPQALLGRSKNYRKDWFLWPQYWYQILQWCSEIVSSSVLIQGTMQCWEGNPGFPYVKWKAWGTFSQPWLLHLI